MRTRARDKRLKALDKVSASVPDKELRIEGLQPNEAAAIRYIVTELRSFDDLPSAGTAHREWRLHHYKPGKPSSPWSIDVNGPRRLLFEYDPRTHEITGLRYDQPH